MQKNPSPEKVPGSSIAPWAGPTPQFMQTITSRVDGVDRALIAVFDGRQPRPDEILLGAGFDDHAVSRWLDGGHQADSMYRSAMRDGAACGPWAESAWCNGEVRPKGWVAYHMIPDSMSRSRWWFAAVGRTEGEFAGDELEAVGLLLRQWKSQFNRPREVNMARLLVGSDHRLIHADPHGEQLLLDRGVLVGTMMDELTQTAQQRWPSLDFDSMHDIALELSGQPWWIRFHRRRAVSDDRAGYWYVELRPLQPDEFITIGVVEDDRIGQALGYIHDNFGTSPTLNQIAAAVHVSPFHFHRLFSKLVGITPKQYVLRRQVQMARWMLRSQRTPISRIATAAGFASHGHFTSTFKRLVGRSPSTYRESDSAS